MLPANLPISSDSAPKNIFIGLDVHKKSWHVSIRCLGRELEHFCQPPCAQTLVSHLHQHYRPDCLFQSAYEAGFCGTRPHEQLLALGIHNRIVHAADIPMSDKQRKNKTDLHDSRSIARFLESGLLNPIHVMSPEQQQLRSLFRCREACVKDVTRANNRLKGFLHFHSIALPAPAADKGYLSNKILRQLSAVLLSSEPGTVSLRHLIEELRHQRRKLYEITRQLRSVMQQQQHGDTYKRLLSVPGIGAVVAMALLCELGGVERFGDPAQYCSYLGLVPQMDASGDRTASRGMQPRCNRHLRPLLVEASWTAIRHSEQLRRYYYQHAQGAHKAMGKRAIVKVARKLALTARAVMRSAQRYQEAYRSARQEHKAQGLAARG